MKGNCNFLPGSARRLELGTVSVLSRAYWSQNSGRSAKRLACRARVSWGTIRGSILFTGTASPRRAERAPPPSLRLSNFGPTSCGLRPRRQPTMETTTALARLDPHATRFALAVARPTDRSLLSGQRHAIALQAERAQLAAISAHPAAMVGTGMPKLRGRTGNEAIVSPEHLFHLRGERSRGRAQTYRRERRDACRRTDRRRSALPILSFPLQPLRPHNARARAREAPSSQSDA